MKKIALILAILMLSSSFVYAGNKTRYKAEVKKIKMVKNAQTKALKKQMKDLARKIEDTESSTTLSNAEKNRRINSYNAQMTNVTNKKVQVIEKYKKDKAELKRKYK